MAQFTPLVLTASIDGEQGIRQWIESIQARCRVVQDEIDALIAELENAASTPRPTPPTPADEATDSVRTAPVRDARCTPVTCTFAASARIPGTVMCSSSVALHP